MIVLRLLIRLMIRFSVVAILALAALAITGPILPEDAEHLYNLATAQACLTGIGLLAGGGPFPALGGMFSPACGETLLNGGWQTYSLFQCAMRYPVNVCLGFA